MLILPRSAIGTLTARGHQAELARDVGLGAAPDVQIAAHVRQTGEALLTRDLDFADVRHYPPKDYGGIVVLRVPDHSTAASGGALDTKSSVVVPLPYYRFEQGPAESYPKLLRKGASAYAR